MPYLHFISGQDSFVGANRERDQTKYPRSCVKKYQINTFVQKTNVNTLEFFSAFIGTSRQTDRRTNFLDHVTITKKIKKGDWGVLITFSLFICKDKTMLVPNISLSMKNSESIKFGQNCWLIKFVLKLKRLFIKNKRFARSLLKVLSTGPRREILLTWPNFYTLFLMGKVPAYYIKCFQS